MEKCESDPQAGQYRLSSHEWVRVRNVLWQQEVKMMGVGTRGVRLSRL